MTNVAAIESGALEGLRDERHDSQEVFRAAAIEGLGGETKTLPCKYFPLIRDIPHVELYVLNMFCVRGSRLQGCIARAWSERRGVSGGLRYGGAVPLGAGPAALAGRLRLPLLRPSGALRAGGSGSLSMQPERDIAHGGHDLHATKLLTDAPQPFT